jgi:[ribosomal protein S18]-alanine N-acetyltransferase
MLLRPFRAADLPILYEIDQACFVPGISYTPDELTGFVGHRTSQTWVAEDEGTVVGFLIAQREPRKLLHIVTIDVVQSLRRRGVGTLLMDAAERWAADNKLRMIGLETAENNVAAQEFYSRRGYIKVGDIPAYYGDGTNAWVMVKQLA